MGCARDLSNASLSGVMCDQTGGCAAGPSGLPGALTDEERDALAAFMMAVNFPQSPKRASDDSLTPTALQGVQDFFTDEDGLGIGSPSAGGIGQAVGFAPVTCADNSGGCHSLPLTNDTNSLTVGGFDTPSMRGLWDRTVQFSNGNISSEEWLQLAQDCADGNAPVGHTGISFGGIPIEPPFDADFLTGDPCAIQSGLAGGFGFNLDPFPGEPSGVEIWDPAVGFTERGQFLGAFEAIFHLAYGVRGAPMWEFLSEMSVGLPGLAGRQLSLAPENFDDPALVAELELVEQYADEGRITAVARNRFWGEYRFRDGVWKSERGAPSLSGPDFRARANALGAVYTVTADLPANISIGGEDRQPLLDIDPDDKWEEMRSQIEDGVITLLAIPRPSPAGGDVIRLGAWYVDPDASVIVDGALCAACSHVPVVAPVSGESAIDVTLNVALTPGPPRAAGPQPRRLDEQRDAPPGGGARAARPLSRASYGAPGGAVPGPRLNPPRGPVRPYCRGTAGGGRVGTRRNAGTALGELPDREVDRLWLRGDERALPEVHRRYRRRLEAVAYRIVGNRADAEDVVQRVFLALPGSSYGGRASLWTYLYRAAANGAVNVLRSRRRALALEEANLGHLHDVERVAPEVGPEGRVFEGEVMAAVARALLDVKPRHRRVLVLRIVWGLSNTEIAEREGVPLATVGTWLRRGREELRRALGPTARELADRVDRGVER